MAKEEKMVARRQPNFIQRYFRETVGELKKVNWPTRKEAVNLTIVVSDCHSEYKPVPWFNGLFVHPIVCLDPGLGIKFLLLAIRDSGKCWCSKG